MGLGESGIGVPSYQEGLSYLNDLGCRVVLSEFGEVGSAADPNVT